MSPEPEATGAARGEADRCRGQERDQRWEKVSGQDEVLTAGRRDEGDRQGPGGHGGRESAAPRSLEEPDRASSPRPNASSTSGSHA